MYRYSHTVGFRASCHCGFTTNDYGTQEAADQALAAHQAYRGH